MNSFSYQRAGDVAGALQQIREPGAKFIGGGSNLLDLMKGGIERPVLLIDINQLPLSDITVRPDGGLRISTRSIPRRSNTTTQWSRTRRLRSGTAHGSHFTIRLNTSRVSARRLPRPSASRPKTCAPYAFTPAVGSAPKVRSGRMWCSPRWLRKNSVAR
jgi:hypothetical protein